MTKRKYYERIKEYAEIAKSKDNGIMFYEPGTLDEASIKLRLVLEKIMVRVDAEIIQARNLGVRRRYNKACDVKHRLSKLIEKVKNREIIGEEDYRGTYVMGSFWGIVSL